MRIYSGVYWSNARLHELVDGLYIQYIPFLSDQTNDRSWVMILTTKRNNYLNTVNARISPRSLINFFRILGEALIRDGGVYLKLGTNLLFQKIAFIIFFTKLWQFIPRQTYNRNIDRRLKDICTHIDIYVKACIRKTISL